jgi:hypothetical protein
VNRQRRYSPVSWQRIAFPRFVRFARSSTSASPGPNGFGTTSPQGLQGEPKVLPHEQLAEGQIEGRGSRTNRKRICRSAHFGMFGVA